MQRPGPSEKLGQPIALRLVQKVSNSGDMNLEKITTREMIALGHLHKLSNQRWHGAHPQWDRCTPHQNQRHQTPRGEDLG